MAISRRTLRSRRLRRRPARQRRNVRGRRGLAAGSARRGAEARLRGFRQATLVSVAITGLLLMILSPEDAGGTAQDPVPAASGDTLPAVPDTVSIIENVPLEDLTAAQEASDTTAKAADEAAGTLRELWHGFVDNLPKYGIAVGLLIAAGIMVRLVRLVLTRVLRNWEQAHAVTALTGVILWLLAFGVAISVLVGDIRALVGSLGLVGLALSWALQTPIESFTGWLLNSFHGFYREGDRIAVGEVFGDVYRINFLTTTVWEYGGPDRPPGSVQAEQPTGRLITFPNNEILTGSVVNYTRDFPYVWDELTVAVANESDLGYAMEVLKRVAQHVVGEQMHEPAQRYRELLLRERLEARVADEPEVYATLSDWGANLTIRYLVGARQKRRWKSDLAVRVTAETNKKEHAGRILPVYPRHQVQLIRPDGTVAEVEPRGAPEGRGRGPEAPA